ncbi:hypothetical protein R3P38DRAFT_2499038 [Favolaschia claudopus]|uniref:MYND-type domain-containing protein n=1 Tax=Favolaschia claudopus TaxID=2862362 RepID=A0AAW0DZ23_9AGAR
MQETNAIKHNGIPEINGFLPVFYALLNPARIPRPHALEIQSADAELYGIIWGGILSVQGCVACIPPHSVFPDVWPRLSAWADFLLTYNAFLSSVSTLNVGPMDAFWVISMGFCGRMAKLAPNRSLILSTPKSRIFASRAWKCFLRSTDWFEHNVSLPMIHGIMTGGNLCLDDVLEGISGTLSDLAGLIMRQCQLLAPLDDSALPPPGSSRMPKLVILGITLDIVHCVDQIHVAQTGGSHYPLCLALVRLGFVDVLISVARILSTPDPAFVTHRPGMMARCLQILEAIFIQDRETGALENAVKQGLLRVLLAISWLPKEQLSAEDILAVQRLIITCFIPATAHYEHLVALEKAIIEIPQGTIANMSSEELVNVWSVFLLAFNERFKARVSFTSDAISSRSVCGNATCGLILDKIHIQCCAGCRAVTYCSKECQIIDWQARHRESCVQERTSLTTLRFLYTRKEYSFLRYLLHQDYLNQRLEIALDHVQGWAVEPNMRFLTEFDYTLFPIVAETVEAPENLPPKLFRGSGLMDTILLRLPDAAKGQREWIFRVARENSAVPKKLKEIATQYHSLDPAEVRKRVGRVLRDEGETVITLDG